MLHIYRNSPLGRENLMQSAYFCKKHFGLSLEVYIPTSPQFSITLGADDFLIQLDVSYTQYPQSAKQRVAATLEAAECPYLLISPPEGDARAVPHLPGAWTIVSCPRVISEALTPIGLGHIGPKVRSLVKSATFPMFIPCLTYKPWTNVTAFFGGSPLGVLVVKEALAIARLSQVPARIHTQLDGITKEECEKALSDAGILGAISGSDVTWRVYERGDLVENLYDVPHDSLAVVGAAGHHVIRELVFGSKLEAIQSTLPNPLVVVGPNCVTPWDEAVEG